MPRMRLPTSERTVLELLVPRDSSYGLELVAESGGRLTRGGIYVTLGRMEQKGLVTSEAAEGGRRLYRATGLGERALLAARIFSGEATLEVKP
jgi:DNA-binding PadR family transcriptional regulator